MLRCRKTWATWGWFYNNRKSEINRVDFKPITKIMAYLRIETKPLNLLILNVYALTETSILEDKDFFYCLLEHEIEKIPTKNMSLIKEIQLEL